jgi:hypothetical protein
VRRDHVCRANVEQQAERDLAELLDRIACGLAEEFGVDRELVLIGPVDFGDPEEAAGV